MSKCVLITDLSHTQNGIVVRTTDEKAAELVNDNKAKYAPKSDWKNQPEGRVSLK